MNKVGFKRTLVQAGVIATLVIPSFVKAEEYSVDGLQNDTATVDSILSEKSVGSASSAEDFAEIIKQAGALQEKQREQVKEVVDLSKKKANWDKKNTALGNIKPTQDAILQKALKKRNTDLKGAKAMSAALQDTTSFVNPNDFSMNDVPKACKKGVDFGATRQLLDQMNSTAGQSIERKLGKYLDNKIEEGKQAQAQSILDTIKFLDEVNNAPEVAEQKGTDPTKADYQIEKHIEFLKKAAKEGKEKHKESTSGVLKEFAGFAEKLFKLRDNDDKVAQIGAQFAKSMEDAKKQTRETAMGSIEKLYSNCVKEKKALITDIEMSKQHILNYLVQNGTEINLATQTAEMDAAAQRQRAQSKSCEDITGNVDAIFQGGNLTNVLNTMRSTKNPTELLNSAVQAMSEVRNIQQQVGQQVRPLIDDCDSVAKAHDDVKKRVEQIAGGGQGGSIGAPQGGVARTSARSTGARRTH